MSGFTHTSCVQNHSISYSRSNSNSAREVIKDDEGTDDCPLSSKKAKVLTLVLAMYIEVAEFNQKQMLNTYITGVAWAISSSRSSPSPITMVSVKLSSR